MENDNMVKILFRFYSEMLEQHTVETLWAEILDANLGHYIIDSIPFYVPFIATQDVVHAAYDEAEEMLTYEETITHSGNSTIWVVITNDATDIDVVRDVFTELDCLSEALSDRYFTMEVKRATNYLRIKNKLNELRSAGMIDYAEPYLSKEHQY
jgi:hypothetical protein